MSHASDGGEIVSTPGGMGSAIISSAMAHSNVDDTGTGAIGSTTPTNVTATTASSSPKKRKHGLSDQEKYEKVKLVLAAISAAKTGGSFKNGSRLTMKEILASYGMSPSQLTRWQQVCVICYAPYKSHKEAFLCTNKLCAITLCKTCVGKEVVRNLVLEDVFRHVSSFQCTFCKVTGALYLRLVNAVDATRREGLRDAILVNVRKLLKENAESIVPLMSGLCSFRSKMKANYVDGAHQLFNTEEVETVSAFLKMFKRYSGPKVDSNQVKTTLKEISFSIQWLQGSFCSVLEDELEHWVQLHHQYEGWFAMMIEFGLKCHERMMGLKTLFNIESYPFWEGLQEISISEQTIIVE